MTEILLDQRNLSPIEIDAELDALARRYHTAGGIGISLLNAFGGQAESLISRLPDAVRKQLGDATQNALRFALAAAQQSRRVLPPQSARMNRMVSTAMGTAGGATGLPGTLLELPATVTFLLRIIQDAAAAQGFDPNAQSVTFDCLRVFASAGPLTQDDGADLAFLSLRLSLSGQAVNQMITTVAPRLASALGHKLAAQSVPILGAAAGASTNYIYSGYYHEVALVHFGLRRLALEADMSESEILPLFLQRLPAPK